MSNFLEDLWRQFTNPEPAEPLEPWQVTFDAYWRRGWRVTGELVGPGVLSFQKAGISVVGRRTNALRGGVYVALRVVNFAVSWAAFAGVVLTALGVTWRSQSPQALLWLPFLGLLAILGLSGIIRGIYRWMLEPPVRVAVPWADVRVVATDGHDVEIQFVTPFAGTLSGRFTATGAGDRERTALAAIRDGMLPSVSNHAVNRPLRPLWVDRVVTAVAVVAAIGGAWWLEPSVSAWLGDPNPGSAVIPASMTAAQLEALRQADCRPLPPSDGVEFSNRREGQDLRWSVAGPGEWEVVPLRLRAGSARVELLDSGDGALPEAADIGITLLVPRDQHVAIRRTLSVGSFDALQVAWCAGQIARVDATRAVNPPTEGDARRDGDDLVVDALAPEVPLVALAVRVRQTPMIDWFHPCEVAFAGGEIAAEPVTTRALRWPGFFEGIDDDPARVYVLPRERWDAIAPALARGGPVQRCLAVDTLRRSGQAIAVYETRSELASDEARQRAARAASTAAPWPADPRAIPAVLERRWAAARAAAGTGASAREGFLDAVDVGRALDAIDVPSGPDALERLRRDVNQRAADGVGDALVYRLGQAWLDRVPVEGTYFGRYDVGHAWTAGAEASATNLVGRYILLDLARQLELDAPEMGIWATFAALLVKVRLHVEHGIEVRDPQSDWQKALTNWVSGNFGYVLERVLRRLVGGAPGASAQGVYRVVGDTEESDLRVRLANLFRGDARIGHVALFAPPEDFVLGFAPRASAPRDALLAASAAYVNGDGCTGVPAQFTAVDGSPQRDSLALDQGGLVVLAGEDDPLHILDIRDGGRLPGVARPLRPMRRLADYAELYQRIRDQSADAFQTHVLYADGFPRIEPGGNSEASNRRLLVDAESAGRPVVAVVDIEERVTLFDAMQIARDALQAPEPDGPGLAVVGIANLDVGACDYVRVPGGWERTGVTPQNLFTVRRR